jgi:hypothetical protein
MGIAVIATTVVLGAARPKGIKWAGNKVANTSRKVPLGHSLNASDTVIAAVSTQSYESCTAVPAQFPMSLNTLA